MARPLIVLGRVLSWRIFLSMSSLLFVCRRCLRGMVFTMRSIFVLFVRKQDGRGAVA